MISYLLFTNNIDPKNSTGKNSTGNNKKIKYFIMGTFSIGLIIANYFFNKYDKAIKIKRLKELNKKRNEYSEKHLEYLKNRTESIEELNNEIDEFNDEKSYDDIKAELINKKNNIENIFTNSIKQINIDYDINRVSKEYFELLIYKACGIKKHSDINLIKDILKKKSMEFENFLKIIKNKNNDMNNFHEYLEKINNIKKELNSSSIKDIIIKFYGKFHELVHEILGYSNDIYKNPREFYDFIKSLNNLNIQFANIIINN